jgi:hypothetical protein
VSLQQPQVYTQEVFTPLKTISTPLALVHAHAPTSSILFDYPLVCASIDKESHEPKVALTVVHSCAHYFLGRYITVSLSS